MKPTTRSALIAALWTLWTVTSASAQPPRELAKWLGPRLWDKDVAGPILSLGARGGGTRAGGSSRAPSDRPARLPSAGWCKSHTAHPRFARLSDQFGNVGWQGCQKVPLSLAMLIGNVEKRLRMSFGCRVEAEQWSGERPDTLLGHCPGPWDTTAFGVRIRFALVQDSLPQPGHVILCSVGRFRTPEESNHKSLI
jgi:hypothetical protein